MKESTRKLSLELKDLAKMLDREIQDIAGERIPFTLIIFTEERASYVSTCERSDSVREIKQLLDHWENGLPDIPAHKTQ